MKVDLQLEGPTMNIEGTSSGKVPWQGGTWHVDLAFTKGPAFKLGNVQRTTVTTRPADSEPLRLRLAGGRLSESDSG